MLIHSIRHNWPKNAGFSKDRPQGRAEYTFVHYCTPVQVTCGSKTYQLQAGACLLVEPGVNYHLYAPEPLVHNWMHLHPQAAQQIALYQVPLNTPFYPNRSNQISEKFRIMEAEFYSEDPFRQELLDHQLGCFWIWLYRAMQPASPSIAISRTLKAAMTDVRMKMLSAPEKKWTLAQLAAMVHLSPSRFHAVYKALFGATPTRDLIDARIHSAKNLLRSQPNISLKDAAEQLGYHDQYHFIRQFKAVTGITPGAYRKT